MAKTSVVVPRNKYLSDSIKTLPSGLLLKDATGMGATTLELQAPRNSIICEPLRSIIDSKLRPGVFAYYAPVSFDQLESYIQSKPEYIKILVTSERLGKLIVDLERLGFNVVEDFFLTIDEIDLHQTQSDFRPFLANALDHYKKFPEDRRAMVTATPYRFSDPTLDDESVVHLKKEGVPSRNIEVVLTSDHVLAATTIVKELEGQTFIFVNSIESILEIIEGANLPLEEVAAHCGVSESNKEKLGSFYHEFTSSPSKKYNFYTSAYFSGCDINVSGNLVTITDPNRPHLRMHPAQIVQVAGRLRKGINRDVVITGLANAVFQNDNYENELWEEASLQFKKYDWLLEQGKRDGETKFALENLRRFEKDEQSLVRENAFSELTINYTYIDYLLIVHNAKILLYKDPDSMVRFLNTKNHNVTSYIEIALEVFDSSGRKSKRPTRKSLYERASKIITQMTIQMLLSTKGEDFVGLLKQKMKELPVREKAVLEQYLHLYYKEEVDAFDKLKGDPKAISSHLFGLRFKELPDDHSLKILVNKHFAIGEIYDANQITDAMSIIASSFDLGKVESSNKATRLLSTFFEIKQDNLPPDAAGKRGKGYRVMGYVNSKMDWGKYYSDEPY